jgi:lysophospholipase L1-like esterase
MIHLYRIGAVFIFVASLVSLQGRNTMYALGDSITAGQNASVAGERYTNQFSAGKGLTLTNLGVGGRGVLEAAIQIQPQTFTRSQTLITFAAGLNDMRRNGAATRTLKKMEACLKTVLIKGMAATNTASGSSGVTRSGTINAYAANTVGGTFPTGTLPCNCATNSPSTVATWTWTFTGTAFGIQFSGSDDVLSNYGTGTISIDGSVVQTLDLGEWYDGVSDGARDNARGPVGFTFHNLTNTSHTIVVTSTGDGNFPIDFFCTLNPPETSAAFLVAEIPYLNSTGYAISPNLGSVAASDICSTLYRSIVNEYKGYGYNINFVETNDYYVLATGLDTDNIHPNNTGHDQITSAFNAAVY